MRAEKSPFEMLITIIGKRRLGKYLNMKQKKSQKNSEFKQGLLKIGQGVIFNHSLQMLVLNEIYSV